MKDLLFKPSRRISACDELLPVELVSYSLTEAMIKEFGITKTVSAIQALYDADHLTEDEAKAMLESINDMMLHSLACYGDFEGRESFEPVTLH